MAKRTLWISLIIILGYLFFSGIDVETIHTVYVLSILSVLAICESIEKVNR